MFPVFGGVGYENLCSSAYIIKEVHYSFKTYLLIVFNLYCVKYCETVAFKFTTILVHLAMCYGVIKYRHYNSPEKQIPHKSHVFNYYIRKLCEKLTIILKCHKDTRLIITVTFILVDLAYFLCFF